MAFSYADILFRRYILSYKNLKKKIVSAMHLLEVHVGLYL